MKIRAARLASVIVVSTLTFIAASVLSVSHPVFGVILEIVGMGCSLCLILIWLISQRKAWGRTSLPDRKSVLGKVVSVERARIAKKERKDEGLFMIVLKKKFKLRRKIMNPFEIVLAHWHKQVKELFPQLHSYQQETLAYCVQGIVQTGSAVMQQVAETMTEYLDSETKMTSHERRMQRFTENERIDVDVCWKTFLETILPYFKGKRMTLVLDPTPYTETSTIVYLGILVSTRVLPIAWCIMPQKEKWDRGQWEIIETLFRQVAPYLQGCECTLLADRGLSCLELIHQCQQVGWHYVLRIKQEEWFRKKYRQAFMIGCNASILLKKRGKHGMVR